MAERRDGESSGTRARARKRWEPSSAPEKALAEAVRRSPFPIALVDLDTGDWVAVSKPAAAQLGYSPEEMTRIYDVAEDDPDIRELFTLVADGRLDGYQAHRAFRHANGQRVILEGSLRAVDLEGTHRLATIVCTLAQPPLTSDGAQKAALDEAKRAEVLDDLTAAIQTDIQRPPVAVAVLDEGWLLEYVSGELTSILGYAIEAVRGTPFLGAIHPQDASDFLSAAARAHAIDAGIGVRVRLRSSQGTWRWCRVMVVVLHGESADRLGVVVSAVPESSASQVASHHLDQNAEEVTAARLLNHLAIVRDGCRLADLSGLTVRQTEIVARLAQGERVPAIARAMFTSPSTVRNHLSAIYKKFGISSQQELLDLLYGRAQPPAER